MAEETALLAAERDAADTENSGLRNLGKEGTESHEEGGESSDSPNKSLCSMSAGSPGGEEALAGEERSFDHEDSLDF